MHKQSRLSVKPRLLFSSALSIEDDSLLIYSISLENKGIGPAIIDSSFVDYNDDKYYNDWEYFFQTATPGLLEYGEFLAFSNISPGGTLSADEVKLLFTYRCPLDKYPNVLEYLALSEDADDLPLDMTVFYHSIYEDERWVVKSNEIPRKLK